MLENSDDSEDSEKAKKKKELTEKEKENLIDFIKDGLFFLTKIVYF